VIAVESLDQLLVLGLIAGLGLMAELIFIYLLDHVGRPED